MTMAMLAVETFGSKQDITRVETREFYIHLENLYSLKSCGDYNKRSHKNRPQYNMAITTKLTNQSDYYNNNYMKMINLKKSSIINSYFDTLHNH